MFLAEIKKVKDECCKEFTKVCCENIKIVIRRKLELNPFLDEFTILCCENFPVEAVDSVRAAFIEEGFVVKYYRDSGVLKKVLGLTIKID